MKRILLVASMIILISIGLFANLLYSSDNVKLDYVNLKEDVVHKGLAVMVDQGDGTYKESDTYPTGNYMLNEEASGCIDKNGKAIANSISYKNGTVSFRTNSSSYCYVYFDKLTLVKYLLNEETRPSSLWTSTLDGDGYRFVGTDPGNYICFGTEDKDTCVGNTDLYMYRIIGIFEDSSGKQYVKLIKKEALNTAYAWHSSYSTDTDWEISDLYTNLHGSYFLSNTTYSYMQNTLWTSKIQDWAWSAVTSLTTGPSYMQSLTDAVYYHEMNHDNKSNTNGVWANPNAKIGLMYVSDFMLSLGESALSLTGSSTYSTTWKTSWIYLGNNDSATLSTTSKAPPSSGEWPMSRYAKSGSYNYAWYIMSNPNVSNARVTATNSVRPVFYLNTKEEYLSGTGTSTDPFVLNGRQKYTITVNSNNDSYGTISLTSSMVYEGDTVTATLNPGSIYKYSSNTCEGTVSGNTLTISNVTSNINCKVTFVEKTKYTVSVSSTNTSYGSVSPSSQTVYEGDSATITLAPKTSYVYESDTCGGTVSGNTLTISNVTSNKTCTVTFKYQTYTVKMQSSGGSGTCDYPLSKVVSYGGTASFNISVSGGSTVTVSSCNGTFKNGVYTVTNVTSDQTCKVYCGAGPATVTFSYTDINGDKWTSTDYNVETGVEHKICGHYQQTCSIGSYGKCRVTTQNSTLDPVCIHYTVWNSVTLNLKTSVIGAP